MKAADAIDFSRSIVPPTVVPLITLTIVYDTIDIRILVNVETNPYENGDHFKAPILDFMSRCLVCPIMSLLPIFICLNALGEMNMLNVGCGDVPQPS